jgi:hypothetical protein
MPEESVQNALNHFNNIGYSLRRLFSVKGAGELFSVFGFFTLILLAGLRGGETAIRAWLQPLGWTSGGLILVVAVHMLLSGELARMGYLAAPVFAVAFSLILTRHPAFRWLRSE